MHVPKYILETDDIIEYLTARNLLKQYQKSKRLILSWNGSSADLKLRKPKEARIWSFRVNKQFRAYGIFDDSNDFVVFEINNHQN